LLHEQVKPDSVYFSIWSEPGEVNYLGPGTIRKADSLFTLARRAAKADEQLLKRVDLAYLPVLFTKLYFHTIGGSAYVSREEAAEVLAQFKRITSENKITRIAEGDEYGNLDKFIQAAGLSQQFYTSWWVIGPFDNENLKGLVTAFAPEKGFDTTKTITGKNGLNVQWMRYDGHAGGYIDLAKIFDPSENVVAYARRTVVADSAKNVQFGVGSNDGVRVWVNGSLVLDRQVARRAQVNEDRITVPLRKGENDILVKVSQLKRAWGFYFTEIR
jgi:hypothetical protein